MFESDNKVLTGEEKEQIILEALKTRGKTRPLKGKLLALAIDLKGGKAVQPYIRSLRAKGEMVIGTKAGYYLAETLEEYTEYTKNKYKQRAMKILVNARDNLKIAYDRHSSIKQQKLDLFFNEVIEELAKL